MNGNLIFPLDHRFFSKSKIKRLSFDRVLSCLYFVSQNPDQPNGSAGIVCGGRVVNRDNLFHFVVSDETIYLVIQDFQLLDRLKNFYLGRKGFDSPALFLSHAWNPFSPPHQ
jgi:hypothetical protein